MSDVEEDSHDEIDNESFAHDEQQPLIHGTNAQNLMEKILRNKILQSIYWKEHCFGLTATTLIPKAMDLQYVGGTYGGNRKPSEFVCLVFKLLQIVPERDIIIQYVTNEHYKYLTALGAFYLRLTGKPVDIYNFLEPLYGDYRKLRRRGYSGTYDIFHMDEFIEELLTKDFSCDMVLPHLPKRHLLEESGDLLPRISPLEDISDDEEEKEQEEEKEHNEYKLNLKGGRGKKRKRETESTKDEDGGGGDSMSIEETNRMRAKLGLKPLQ
jgi:pre-mRNA-splicing factor 38A